ncbi:four-helix bundle copper-binding protein [Nocardia sp. NPDC004568]|uniref:four-helix bundle copper-binding protein n=1 Tax=Nocardia sp. NPDC004568 TaxID=3154551 RepID=UPI0033BC7945
MTHAAEMLDLYPHDLDGIDRTALTRCIEECFSCAQVCTACADSCLGEPGVADLVTCIRTDLDCADICDTTGRVLTRRTGGGTAPTRPLLEACAAACAACRDECLRHAGMHEHCEVCAEACRRCEQACRTLLATLG